MNTTTAKVGGAAGAAAALALLGGVIGFRAQAAAQEPVRQAAPKAEEAPARRDGQLVTLYHPVPPLTGDRALWLNAEKPVAFEKGKVYVVHFWTFGCINCKRNLPAYQRWHKKYAPKGVTFVGVHTPETEEEKDFGNVKKAVAKNGIAYPVLFDPQSDNWKRWQQQWWPTVYLIDRQGRVRHYWMGELEWQNAGGTAKMARLLDRLIAEPDPNAKAASE